MESNEATKTHFKEMTLVEHLEDLRQCLFRIVFILLVGVIFTYSLSDYLTNLLLVPLQKNLGAQGQIVFLNVFDKVIVQLQLSFWSCAILTSPLWFWQIWKFIKPGLYEKEIHLIRPFIYSGFLLFCAGVAFAYFVIFPNTLALLLNFGTQEIHASINFSEYMLLSVKVLVLFGFLFQIPNVMVILGFLEIVTKQSLAALRRYLYVAFTVLAGVITPPDVISQIMLLLPLILLYEIGVLAVALIVHPYLHKKYASTTSATPSTKK